MFRIDLSRRLSEFVGVLLFALALVWLIALATYSPADAVWFFNSGGETPPLNLVGMAGSFLSEASYQVLGITSWLFPPLLAILGWFAFWCRPIEAAYTKLIGLALMLACLTSLLDLSLRTVEVAGKSFLAGGYAGYGIAVSLMSQLNRTGAFILVVTTLVLSVILATQFSFSRFFAQVGSAIVRLSAHAGSWWTARRTLRQQRRAVKRKARAARAAKAARARKAAEAEAETAPEPTPVAIPVAAAAVAGDTADAVLADLPLRPPDPDPDELPIEMAQPAGRAASAFDAKMRCRPRRAAALRRRMATGAKRANCRSIRLRSQSRPSRPRMRPLWRRLWKKPSRIRPPRCSTPPRPASASMSGSSTRTPGCWRRSAASFRWTARWCRSIRVRWSPPSSSSRTPA